jgi:hypothetical protein
MAKLDEEKEAHRQLKAENQRLEAESVTLQAQVCTAYNSTL